MTDDAVETKLRTRRPSSLPPTAIPEESSITSTLDLLVSANPLANPDAAVTPIASVPTSHNNTPRTRRRSSVSIIQALVTSSHLLRTKDARNR